MVRTPCRDKSGLKKGTWTAEEDQRLIAYVTKYGHRNWRQLPRFAGLARCGKSCRLRWKNYLRPDIKRGYYTHEEEETIVKLHAMLGNRWSMIASYLPGRSDNEIKNHWHAHLKKRFQQSSTTNEKVEASKSKPQYSPVKSGKQDLVEITSTFQINSPVASSSSQETSLSDYLCTTSQHAQGERNLVVDDFADCLDTKADPTSAYTCTELDEVEISYFLLEIIRKLKDCAS